MGKRKGKIHIGTSGWHYAHWKGPFYPREMQDKMLLPFYIEHFSTVEINRTFYSLPKKCVFERYSELAPRGFIFSIKASRYITHVKRLKDPKPPLRRLLGVLKGLSTHLGPILFQLPPKWKANHERLEIFLKSLPKGHRYTFEFRDESWLQEDIYTILRKHKAAFCIYELDHFITPSLITADFIYVRLHGPERAYGGKYSLATLKKWASLFQQFAKEGKDVYCYFDNDEAGYAVKNALQLQSLLKIKPIRRCKP